MATADLKGDRAGPSGSWLVFALGSKKLAVELSRVLEIQEGRDIFPVPLVTGRIAGVTYWRDQALPVLSPSLLEGALGSERAGATDQPKLLGVIEVEGHCLGILFDRIERVVGVGEIEKGEQPLPLCRSEVVEPCGHYRGSALYRLNLERILERVRAGEPKPGGPRRTVDGEKDSAGG